MSFRVLCVVAFLFVLAAVATPLIVEINPPARKVAIVVPQGQSIVEKKGEETPPPVLYGPELPPHTYEGPFVSEEEYESVVHELIELRKQIDRRETEIQALRQEVDQYQKDIAKLRKQNSRRYEEVEALDHMIKGY